MRLVRILALSMALPVLAGCEPKGQDVRLPSGRQIKVLSMGKMYFTQGPAALVLRYRTAVSLDDLPALRAEADEIWQSFRPSVEKAQLTVGLLNANEPPRGFIFTYNRAFTFSFTKSSADGQWSKDELRVK